MERENVPDSWIGRRVWVITVVTAEDAFQLTRGVGLTTPGVAPPGSAAPSLSSCSGLVQDILEGVPDLLEITLQSLVDGAAHI